MEPLRPATPPEYFPGRLKAVPLAPSVSNSPSPPPGTKTPQRSLSWGAFQGAEDDPVSATGSHPLMQQSSFGTFGTFGTFPSPPQTPPLPPGTTPSPASRPPTPPQQQNATVDKDHVLPHQPPSPEAPAHTEEPFGTRTSAVYRRVSSEGVAPTLEGLSLLAKQGSWRAIVEKVKEGARGASLPHQLAYKAHHILGLVKLRMYGAAADELRTLGDLDSPQYQYQAFPHLYPGKRAGTLRKSESEQKQGSWRAIVEKVKEGARGASLPHQLAYKAHHILGLVKLRMYGAAADELRTLGDLDSPQYQYQAFPHLYPGKRGSMVPFALRWVHAELAHRSGNTGEAIDRLYALLAFCSARISALQEGLEQSSEVSSSEGGGAADDEDDAAMLTSAEAGHRPEGSAAAAPRPPADEAARESGQETGSGKGGGHGGSGGGDEEGDARAVLEARWQKRRDMVLYALLSHHVARRDYEVALQWLRSLLLRRAGAGGSRARTRGEDPHVLSSYAHVQLQMGDLEGAKRTFARVEEIASDTPTGAPGDRHVARLVQRNRGLLLFALKQYEPALAEFDAVLASHPGDYIAANNKALCLMYVRDLMGAIKVLEDALQNEPLAALDETLVLNLCSMYELASTNCAATKRTLSNWLMRLAPDDFDLMCTRL
eukprot:jgi/Mesen1/5132/ME000255S04106